MPGSSQGRPHPKLVTVNHALETLSIGRTKFYELVNQKKLKTVAIGRRRLVDYASLERLADTGAA